MTQEPQPRRYDRSVDPAAQLIDRQGWIDRLAVPLQRGIATLFRSGGRLTRSLENALHGVPIGTPLHPVIVTVPIGAWTVAGVLDLLDLRGRREVRAGADIAVNVGIVGAAFAAVTGLTDWHKVGEFKLKRRVGFVHGSLNATALLMYIASSVLRARGARGVARPLGWAAFMISGASAHLGGTLVYKEAQGVTHVADLAPPDGFVPVLEEQALPENRPTRVLAGEVPVVLVRQEGQVYALAERCAHLGGPLAEGELQQGSLRCPWHGSRFRLQDGSVLEGPSAHAQPCFVTRVRNGKIEVQAARTWN
ncbi:nitrite reductase/ring-hydroxylating ferredoxin subunit/uncharacterized membrane protein [Deinobacterium chartae]|uniref:Nitrite reductase/ring-hydroxylating ferredoxin subunit/uncharacterized membrane protein n=1 Tax=Deinobacterium chartae TaxID=521158 RepID=A0A841I0H5_9DEIO|nr:Rieske 2Fe-2S domain-containing protein [Deinobacterium chartae]MBB6098606.1 nitrite reductase/ring-hydroxylating ferredoxin subunit/uncharacterized membrane protein [Deinobacterium chartae]